jgi:transglutaminase-like putative cysteine protease
MDARDAVTSLAVYKITHTTTYRYVEAVPVCHNEVHLTPRDTAWQKCLQYRLHIKPHPDAVGKRNDYFGNSLHHFSIQEGHRRLSISAHSRVEVRLRDRLLPEQSPPWDMISRGFRFPMDAEELGATQFRLDSPSVITSSDLRAYAQPSFPAGRPILEAVADLTTRIHTDFKYDPRATTVNTPLEDVLELRRGVCQDFAHLEIGCLRSLGLAARYVSGYLRTIPPPGKPRLVGADASHAWLSVFCKQSGWIDVDPTNDCFPTTDHITVAWGRDYTDVCPINGVFVGGGAHSMAVSVDVEPLFESSDIGSSVHVSDEGAASTM